MLELEHYTRRSGEWLLLDATALQDHVSHRFPDKAEMPGLQAGSHPHHVRQWLLASSLFPAKWVNRLFSVGGIKWSGNQIGLLAFPAAVTATDKSYRNLAGRPQSRSAASPPVLYEDDYCLVLNKPAEMPVHAAYEGHAGTLDEAACRHMLAKNDPLPVRHIHRLDDETSGPVLYAKNDLAQWKLDEAMRNKEIDRIYVAVVQGLLRQEKGTVDGPIGKDRHHASRRRVTPSGDTALTTYEKIGQLAGMTIVRLRLETGRTHQIRVHMSHIGHPLVGDTLYGGSSRLLGHQALHGERLVFSHPLTGKLLDVQSPWPDWLKRLSGDTRP
ncbi:RluA family pseudouridine synthase [Paenibacillus sp. 1011MAR3C5]|uniref:RluA family pseudouridine synthase n=1 Tax=Paenibacillus sp. 1011MAR3C5 TaxID=1675787 RepID=UPI000E6D1CE8|nr:RluA family pseudouridine synthase [Paenibacillus sp. 1011MAR3C5]RJE91053.1 RluA family pseudouridine synthase [Paenibacillus sp. 1011MAR3C5]